MDLQLRIWAKVWCLPIPTTMDALQHTATHTQQPTATPMPPRLVPPTHMLHWYRKPHIHALTHDSTSKHLYMVSVYSTLILFLSSYQSSVLSSGFGSLNAPKPTPAADVRASEPLNGPRLGQRAGPTLASASNVSGSKDAGPSPIQNPAPVPSAEIKTQRVENSSVTAHHSKWMRNLTHCKTCLLPLYYARCTVYCSKMINVSPFSSVAMKLQPEPSAVLSQLSLRQQSSNLPSTEPLGMLHAPHVPTPPGTSA